MPKFSDRSARKLETCHEGLKALFQEVVRHFDCTIVTGHRTQEEQDTAYHQGMSKTPWPRSRHNQYPSFAVDAAPYPIDWKDRERFLYFAGFVRGIAAKMGIPIRWGGDWDNDTEVRDNKFDDLVHFELIVSKKGSQQS